MNFTKVLIFGHPIVRRVHQLLIEDNDLWYDADLGINTHARRYKETGGRTIDCILRHNVLSLKDSSRIISRLWLVAMT